MIVLLMAQQCKAQDKPKLDTVANDSIYLVIKGDTLLTYKDGNKRYVLIDGKRRNVFRREPKDNKGHYEFAKF